MDRPEMREHVRKIGKWLIRYGLVGAIGVQPSFGKDFVRRFSCKPVGAAIANQYRNRAGGEQPPDDLRFARAASMCAAEGVREVPGRNPGLELEMTGEYSNSQISNIDAACSKHSVDY